MNFELASDIWNPSDEILNKNSEYMCPEVRLNEYDCTPSTKGDVWSFGVTLLECMGVQKEMIETYEF